MPIFEIFTDAVICKLGATVSRPDPEKLFYLLARGMDAAEAERALVGGFLLPILKHEA